jgi:dCMP deaminase
MRDSDVQRTIQNLERMMKQKFIDAHMKVAEIYAELSSAKRLHVGAIIVKDDRIISIGYNGMPAGWSNICEFDMYDDAGQWVGNRTRPEVLHAETNAIAKLAKSSESGLDATLFVTHSPCLDCAKLVYQSGINSVYYRNTYKNEDGIDFLKKCNVKVEKV